MKIAEKQTNYKTIFKGVTG